MMRKLSMESFLDADGNVLAGSIAEKCEIEVDDGKLGMFLLGKNEANPVLLVCGGDPCVFLCRRA